MLRPVIDKLLDSDAGTALVGAMLADGIGSIDQFEAWCYKARELVAQHNTLVGLIARAWSASRRIDRRDALARSWSRDNMSTWMENLVLERWLDRIGAKTPLAHSLVKPNARRMIDLFSRPLESSLDVALGVVLTSVDPLWPEAVLPVGLLNVWPSRRRSVGVRLQTLVTLSNSRSAVGALLEKTILASPRSDPQNLLSAWFAHQCNRYSVVAERIPYLPNFMKSLALDLYENQAPVLAFDQDLFHAWMRWSDIHLMTAMLWSNASQLQDAGLTPAGHFDGYSTFIRPLQNQDWAQDLLSTLDIREDCRGIWDFLTVDSVSLGYYCASTRLLLRARNINSSAAHLLAAATGERRAWPSLFGPLSKSLEAYEISGQTDPLWPALARHLARRSTPEDKALLEDLARHPEKRDPPLSWGLKYIVRGDILLEDGSVVTLDELCDQHNLPHLPYLEDLPPELEIDWEEDTSPQ